MANIVRTIEVTIAITLISIVISWISSCIPTVVEFSGVILPRLSSILFSPRFVFVIGNVIVITLFANSSPSKTENSGKNSTKNDDVSVEVESEAAEVVEFPTAAVEMAVDRKVTEKVYRRSQSEAIDFVEKPKLRRSATVPCRKVGCDEVSTTETEVKAKAKSDEEEELSNEEFNRRVEEFIKKQRNFLNEESKILVLSN
ncbi:uncharacterized protein LOC141586771 [Silene latifolia]|uniref:uncharacterized protein LOC141586771 n=1 Tax=Silene latifolia TaxID=37657 RepID=UPI003D787A60